MCMLVAHEETKDVIGISRAPLTELNAAQRVQKEVGLEFRAILY